ncbi:hypothetical protein MXAN_0648 [Myxococcus xanthus DK 1622]|uniref:Uncharacterized protein n=1 Tax=Myxococcus xanthus (strain DK1622) TaxID=246197 RepID=Q1DEK6_MYXXD|nr:hypothetical protein MXAN_0648 [Myxococcus xanthus DK 1622]
MSAITTAAMAPHWSPRIGLRSFRHRARAPVARAAEPTPSRACP